MVIAEKFKMHILIFINILYLCAYCQCPATTKGEINRKEDKQIMDLLASILPVQIKPSFNEKEKENMNEDFNENLVKPLGNYLLLTYNYILRAINKHKNEPQLKIVDNFIPMIVLDDYEIGQLLRYYYHQSQNIGQIFKICWFYIEINRIWEEYKSRNQNNLTIEDFKTMFEKKIYYYVLNLDTDMHYTSIENPEKQIKEIKDKLYKLSGSKMKFVDQNVDTNACNWFIIKNLSMKPLMESKYFYNLQMTKVTYNDDELYLKAAYDNILSNMDVYSLFKYNHICKAVVLRQFNEWLINIFVNLSQFHELGLRKDEETLIKGFEAAYEIIRDSILRFKMFIEVDFNYDIAENAPKYTNAMYTFIESKGNNEEIEGYVKKYIKEDQNKIYNFGYNKLLSITYRYKARFAFYTELNQSDYIMNIENEDSHQNNNHIFKEETPANEKNNFNDIYVRSIRQVNSISDKPIGALVNDLLINVSHMNLMINVYKCLIAKQLNIGSRYYLLNGNKMEEFDNNIDYKPEPPILTAVLERYSNGYEFLNGSKTAETLPLYKDEYPVSCDAYEMMD